MLESTLHAVHSSFHAVLGVAEHLTKMKLQVSQVSNTLFKAPTSAFSKNLSRHYDAK